jgi:hypothetical protein
MNNQSLFLVQGVFFFAYFGEPLCYYHFSGMIHPSESKDSVLAGQLTDRFGDSILSNVRIDEKIVSFTKIYKHRADPIFLVLRKSSKMHNLWVGTYAGEKTGAGKVNCFITEVPLEFLTPDF